MSQPRSRTSCRQSASHYYKYKECGLILSPLNAYNSLHVEKLLDWYTDASGL